MPQTKTQHATALFCLLTVIFYIFTLQHCINIEEMVTLKCDKDSKTVVHNMIVKAGMNCGVYMLQPVYPSWGTSLIRSKKKTDLSDHGIAHPGVKTRETLHIKSPGSSTVHRDMLGNGGVRCSLSDTHLHTTLAYTSPLLPHIQRPSERA